MKNSNRLLWKVPIDCLLVMTNSFVQLGPVKSYVQMLCENQDLKFIIFAYHRVMLDSICEQLVDDDVTFIRIDGSTVTSDRPVFMDCDTLFL